MKKLIFLLFFILSAFTGFSQCTTCTTCSVSATSGCTWTVSSSSSTDYTINATGNQKLCITGGTYTGDITIQGGTVVVASGATFNPGSWSFGIFDVYGGTLEIKSGATATLPSMSYNGSDPFTFNNCSNNVTLGGNFSSNGSGIVTYNNVGTISGPTRDFNFNGAGTICNGGNMIFDDFSANGSTGSSINNQGTITLNGNLSQNGDCPINICPNSKILVGGNFSSNGGLITGTSSCGAIKVTGSSSCTGCTVTGPMDFCDPNATSPAGNPVFNSCTGCTVGASVTKCTCSILPIELLSFSANIVNDKVELNWITASERNNDYFIIERSFDGGSLEGIGTINGHGNSNTFSYYKYIDNDYFINNEIFYRLKQVDYNGRYSYSSIIKISEERKNILFSYYDHITNTILISFYSDDTDVSILISNLLGQSLYSDSKNYRKGFYTISIPADTFKAGIIFISVAQNSKHYYNKIWINK